MKTKILLSLLFLSTSMTGFCTTWTILSVTSGDVFVSDSITINLGDSVNFDLSLSSAYPHDAVEVSQATWNANGATPLPGGFSVPTGIGGLVLPAQLTVGVHYYVCTLHSGMKGRIFVVNPNGINQPTFQTNISVYPNPATDLITVKASNNILGLTFIIADQTGRQVMTGKLNDETTSVNISELATGIYLFQVGELSKQTFKVVKK